jgi:hypothetical protein
MLLVTCWCIAVGAAGTFQTSRQSSLAYAQAADALSLHGSWIVGKRLPTGGGEIPRSRERVVFATGNAIRQPVADGRNTRTGRGGARSTRFLANRLDGLV